MTDGTSDRRFALVCAGIALAANFPLFLNAGIFWDGLLYDQTWRYGDFHSIYQSLSSAGRPGWAVIYYAFGHFIDPVWGFRFASAAGIGASAAFAFLILHRLGLPRLMSAMCATLAACAPANAVLVSQTPAIYPFLQACALGAALCALPERNGSGIGAPRLAAGALLACIACTFEALLIPIAGIPLVAAFARRDAGDWFRAALRALQYPVIAVAGAVLSFRLFFPVGDYARERNVRGLADWLSVVVDFSDLARFSFGYDPMAVFGSVAGLAGAAFLAAGAYAAVRRNAPEESGTLKDALALCACGALLFAILALPFAAGGRVPATGWSYRHALLLGLPAAMIVVGFLSIVGGLFEVRHRQAFTAAGAALVAALQLSALWTNYSLWQSRWAKDQAMVTQLAHVSWGGKVRVLWIDDQYPRTLGERLRFYEWAALAERAWGRNAPLPLGADYLDGPGRDPATRDRQVQVAADTVARRTSEVVARLGKDVSADACQVRLTVRPGVYVHPPGPRMAIAYLLRSLTSSPDQFADWLRIIAEIEVTPVSNCVQ
ncbi:MAG: hypothetical protein HY059_16695 [Proteobacteria bacterium]|nr:hypothetical protein [Pseudomonadota bacterium]